MPSTPENIYDHNECFNCQVFRKTKKNKSEYIFVGNGYALQANKGTITQDNLFCFFVSPEEPSGHPDWFDVRNHDVMYLLLGAGPEAPRLAFEVVVAEATPDASPYNIRYIMNRRDDLHVPGGTVEYSNAEQGAQEELQVLNNELFDRLRLLGSAARTWLQFDRAELKRRVCDQVIAHFRAAPSPEPREGIENGLALLGVLLQQGGEHGLYDTTIRQLDRMIFKAIAEMDDDEQVVLLLPMVDVEDLATDWDASEWAKVLRTRLVPEWEEEMRSIVLHRVELASAA